jgi:hypothetical protein
MSSSTITETYVKGRAVDGILGKRFTFDQLTGKTEAQV